MATKSLEVWNVPMFTTDDEGHSRMVGFLPVAAVSAGYARALAKDHIATHQDMFAHLGEENKEIVVGRAFRDGRSVVVEDGDE